MNVNGSVKGMVIWLCLMLGLASPLWAAAPAQELDEMVVTGTRTEHNVMETPGNIAVISAEDIQAMDVQNIADVLQTIPGVFYTNSSGMEPKISLRGTRIGMSSSALVLVNGIPMGMGKFGYTDFEAIPVEIIERIEVVKGPMSSLYGGDSARGVINVITRRSQKPLEGRLSAAVGSYDERRASALVSGATDEWDYSLTAKKKDTEAYRDRNAMDNTYATAEVGRWLSDQTRIRAYVNVTDKKRTLAKALDETQREENPRQAPDYSLTENLDLISGVNLKMTTRNWDLNGSVYYKYRDKNYWNYLDTPSKTYREDLDEDTLGIREIYTLKLPVAGLANRLSLGMDYDHCDMNLMTLKGTGYDTLDPKKTGTFGSRKLGLFVQDELTPVDGVTITAGLRYDYFEFINEAEHDFSEGGTKPFDTRPDFDRLNPRVAVNWQPLSQLAVFAGYTQSYQAPSVYDFYYSSSYMAKNNYSLKPETFTQYEAGVRYRFNAAVNADVTVYHLVIDDMLDSAYNGSTYMGKQNVNQATIKGLELGLSGRPWERVGYKIAYTLTDAVYSEDFAIKGGENINGNRLTKTPRNRVNIDVNLDLLRLDAGTLVWNLNFMAQDGFEMDNANTEEYPGYGLLNTLVRWKAAGYELFLGVDNVLDKDYDGYAYRSKGKNWYYPAAGTTVSSGVEIKF